MKKKLSLLLLLGILQVPILAQAQTVYTPNLGLALPPAAPGTWGEQYNNNFTTLDSAITGTFGTAIAFSGDLTPAQITSDQTDYNPTGLSTANVLRLSSDAARSINSLAGGSDGRTIILYNVGAQQITLKNNSGIGTAANQFLLNADVVMGINQGAIVQYDSTSARWRVASSIGTTGAGSAHVIQDETSNLTARPTLNFTGAGITCTDNSGSNRTDCTVAGGSTDLAAAYTWTGVHSWRDANFSLVDNGDITKVLKFDIAGFSAGTTRTWSGPNASTRLIGDSDFSTTGIMSRTASGTYAGRTLTGGVANEFILTNADGVLGNPTIALGTLAVKTDRANTYSAGLQDFSLATMNVPGATGYTPTTSRLFGYNNTTNRFVGGVNGATKVFAFTDEIQPLASNLTALAGLAGTNNTVPVFSGAGMLGTALPLCSDSAGQHLNYDTATHTWSCGTSSTGGLSSGTSGKYLIATSTTTYDTSGALSEAAGVVNASGGLTVGNVGTNKLTIDPAAVTGTKTLTAINVSGTLRPTTGAITTDHVVAFAADGSLKDGGAAGTGTWTDGSTNTGTNKTLVATAAGGTNTITLGLRAFFDASSLTLPSGSTCTLGAVAAINSGPSVAAVNCTDAGTSSFEGQLTLPQDIATLTFTITVNDLDSSSQHFAGDFSAMCRNNATAVNSTWGTSQSVDVTMTTASNNYTGTTAAVTPNGTCTSGGTLFWRFVVNTTPFTDGGNARVIGVLMKQAS